MKLAYFLLIIVSSIFLCGCSSGSSYYSNYDSEYYDDYEEEYVTSENWECTEDCSGHEAGYEWASDKGINDIDDCGGNSDSFIEGCEAYVNESQIEYEEYYEYYNEDDYIY